MMKAEDKILEFIRDMANTEGQECDELEIFEEWFMTGEESALVWNCSFSGYIVAKGWEGVHLSTTTVQNVEDALLLAEEIPHGKLH